MSALSIDYGEFERNALGALRLVVLQALESVAESILLPIQAAVLTSVHASPEYASLLAGDLRAQFGIAEPQGIVDAIALNVSRSVVCSALPGSGDILGTLRVEILREDMSDALSVEGTSYYSLSLQRGTSILVEWLNWLLLAGTSIVIADWEVKTDRGEFVNTRSGKGVMVHPTKRASHGYQVPPEFSGIVDDNWLTRCMLDLTPVVLDIVLRGLERY